MKKLLTVLFVLFIAAFSQAQWVFESFDNAVGPVYLDPPVLNTNFFASGANPKMDLANDPDHFEGTGAMRVDYTVEASEGWGGYTVRRTYTDAGIVTAPYIDLSAGTEIKLRYKVLTPADTTQEGSVFMELKPADYDEVGRDLWNHHMQIDMFDASGEWHEVTIPMVYSEDNNFGFNLQTGGGNSTLEWDKIKGFELTCVYLTAGNNATPPTASGSILLDGMELVGNRYNPFQTFDDAASDFSFDDMSWAGAGKSTVNLSNNSTDFVEGSGSMQLDYVVNASQSWGGYLNITDTMFVSDTTLPERTALVLFVKNLNPIDAGTSPGRLTMRFFLLENSTGANEDWVIDIPVNFTEAGEWTRYYLPLKVDTVWTDSLGHMRFPQHGFAQKWWEAQGDQTFNPDAITGYKIELSAGGDDQGPINETFTGTLLFDIIQTSGFQFADKTAPAAPVANVIPSSNSNIVTWADVPGESGEKYFVYFSEAPFTDVDADGVFAAYTSEAIPHGTQVYEHALRSANTDKAKTYYYAVVCKDFAGNVSEPGFFGPVTNTAKGVPTVSITPPTNFVADGDLSEWSDAQPSFLMQSALGTANVVLNVDGDADCSADIKVAIDNTYLYVMMDVTDDLVFNNNATSYENDAPDLFIGLYNITKSHVAYWRGETPDYHLRFGYNYLRSDESGSQCDYMLQTGSENYYYGEKFPSGYVVEARIPLDTLATKRNSNITSTDIINWKVGDKVPFDVVVNDNDSDHRDGMIFYSPTNKDNGWQNVNSWTYTWISDDVTDVKGIPVAVYTFDLAQNFPNPFNPTTLIQYSIAEAGLVTVKVYDILGRQVAELVNQNQSAGTYQVDFNAGNLSSGVYIYQVESGSFKASKKMMLMK